MNRLSTWMMCAVAASSLLACGGKSKPATTGTTAGPSDGLPFDKAAVQAKLAATDQNDACRGDAGGTLSALYDEQKGHLTQDGGAVDESFACNSVDEGIWECTWSVFSKPTGAPDPDDPCAGEGGSAGYQIIVRVDGAGTLDASSIVCVAPG